VSAPGASARFPYPPLELASRAGALTAPDPVAEYEEVGARAHRLLLSFLPADWSFAGRRILDFGCGTGRVIRHFADQAGAAELVGCDIHGPSVEWAERHLSPPFRFFRNEELPPIDAPDESFDLVYGMSVFTHLTDSWSRWLLELHRILRPGGLAVLTFLGEDMAEPCGVVWDEDRIGMLELHIAAPWVEGGPLVVHSPWWLRAHWGRAFEIVELRPRAVDVEPPLPDLSLDVHGAVALRKDGRPAPTVEELERLDPGEPREAQALLHNRDLLKREAANWRHRAAATEAELQRVAERAHLMETSNSWRMTAGLRRLRAAMRRS
jgi:SAM-dependent methyltransferase